MGPLQLRNNCNYIFTTIDHASKWLEAIPLAISAADCACALGLPALGYPVKITSGHGPRITSSLLAALCEILSILYHQTTQKQTVHLDRLHRRLKKSLACLTAAETWADEIPWILFGLRS